MPYLHHTRDKIDAAYKFLRIERNSFIELTMAMAKSLGLNSSHKSFIPDRAIDNTIVRIATSDVAASLANSAPLTVGCLIDSAAISRRLNNGLHITNQEYNKPLQALELHAIMPQDIKLLLSTRNNLSAMSVLELVTLGEIEKLGKFVPFKTTTGISLKHVLAPSPAYSDSQLTI